MVLFNIRFIVQRFPCPPLVRYVSQVIEGLSVFYVPVLLLSSYLSITDALGKGHRGLLKAEQTAVADLGSALNPKWEL